MSIVLDGTTGVTAPALTGPIDAANLTGALPAIDGSALTGLSSGGMTLLGTIATTSGASVTLSGLTLTDYKFLQFSVNGVSSTSNATLLLNLYRLVYIDTAAQVAFGGGFIDLSNGVFMSSFVDYNGTTMGRLDGGCGPSGLTTASTSITFTIDLGAFDAGSIKIYGVA